MAVNYEGLKYYFNSVDTSVPSAIKEDVLTLIDQAVAAEAAENAKKHRTVNKSGVVQVDIKTDKELARFKTQKEALEAIGKENKTGISDAICGRTSTHVAYGYKWYFADQWDQIAELKKIAPEFN